MRSVLYKTGLLSQGCARRLAIYRNVHDKRNTECSRRNSADIVEAPNGQSMPESQCQAEQLAGPGNQRVDS
jgi:hypothetical protein